MANSYTNIITFILTTIFYYMSLKPTLSLDVLTDQTKYQEYSKNNYLYLAIYLLLVMIIQFIVNTSIISSTCGGSIPENIGAAGFLTFIPWMLIFGVIILILVIYPGFKSVFSDVIGYFYISTEANKIITELLVNRNVRDILEEPTTPVPENQPQPPLAIMEGGAKSEKQKIEDAADAIVKICGNTSILINQMVPENFEDYWKLLNPLMKDQYKNESPDTIAKKNELFELVVTRDNVGEAMWYIYTGILLTSIVQLKITSRGCKSSPATMEKNYNEFLQKEEAAQATKAEAENTVYTISS